MKVNKVGKSECYINVAVSYVDKSNCWLIK